MTHTLDIAALVAGARYCAHCQDSGYRPLYYLNVGRVFQEPCQCKAGDEIRALKRKTERDLIELGDRLPY